MWNPTSTPKGAAYAREIIATMERETKSVAARKQLAESAIRRGNYDDAGKAVFRDYLTRENR